MPGSYKEIPGLGKVWIPDKVAVPTRPGAPLMSKYGFPHGRYEVDGQVYWIKSYWSEFGSYATKITRLHEVNGKSKWVSVDVDTLAIVDAIRADAYTQAINYGRLKNRCSQCGNKLTLPGSIKRGMGPDCAKKAFPNEWLEATDDQFN